MTNTAKENEIQRQISLLQQQISSLESQRTALRKEAEDQDFQKMKSKLTKKLIKQIGESKTEKILSCLTRTMYNQLQMVPEKEDQVEKMVPMKEFREILKFLRQDKFTKKVLWLPETDCWSMEADGESCLAFMGLCQNDEIYRRIWGLSYDFVTSTWSPYISHDSGWDVLGKFKSPEEVAKKFIQSIHERANEFF